MGGGVAAAVAARLALCSFACLVVVGRCSVVSLTEANFVSQLQAYPTALVVFVSPWCLTCRGLAQELKGTRDSLARHHSSSRVQLAQCDVSRELMLADRYQAHRPPVVLYFPDTRILAPGLQLPWTGRLDRASLITFVQQASRAVPPRLASPSQLAVWVSERRGGGATVGGLFVGFFRGGASLLQDDAWPLDCMARQQRAFTLARGPAASDTGEALWAWAGLAWDPTGDHTEEAVVSVEPGSGDGEPVPSATFVLGESHNVSTPSSWRMQAEEFCAWVERQALGTVTVFDAARAAALDGTFDWLLLLFAPCSDSCEPQGASWTLMGPSIGIAAARPAPAPRFRQEQELLRIFWKSARRADGRYAEVLPVLVPLGDGELEAFRSFFGAPAPVKAPRCLADHEEPTCDLNASGDDTSLGRWDAVLFNTRTRRQHRLDGIGWEPGDEASLGRFVDAVLDGLVPAHFRSSPPGAAAVAPDLWAGTDMSVLGVAEITGASFGAAISEPVAAGLGHVLLLLYAPWCSHSLAFQFLWRKVAAEISDVEAAEAGHGSSLRLRVAQMDATRNEHPDLPYIDRFPTVLLCLPKAEAGAQLDDEADPGLRQLHQPSRTGNPATATRPSLSPGLAPPPLVFLAYAGEASQAALLSWLVEHSTIAAARLGATPLRSEL